MAMDMTASCPLLEESNCVALCPTVTQKAAQELNIPASQGQDVLLCSADELELLSLKDCACTIIAVYGKNPKQAYACRKAAYDRADACLTLSPETATRLQLLHPSVFLAESGSHALAQVATFTQQHQLHPQVQQKNDLVARPMTILFVTHNFMVGGLEQVVIDLASLAKSMGHMPIISYADKIDPITQKDLEVAGLEHIQLPETTEDRTAFLKEQNVSVVNAHYATIVATESHSLGIPYLQTIHNMYLWLDEAGIALWRELDKLTSGYIAVSANAAMVADLRLGLPPEKMVIVPNGVAIVNQHMPCPPEQDKALRRELGIPSEGIVFVQVASINGVKAHTIAVEAFAKALETRKDIYLILLGKDSDQAYTERVCCKIETQNLGKHILMPGYRKDVHRFLNLARAMVAPSFIEGWSLAISEALQLGVPVIATDVGGACEQFRGTENILLPSYFEDVEHLSAESFFAALCDPDIMAKGAAHLAKALLDMAGRPTRKVLAGSQYHCRLPEEAYITHLEIMQHLIQKKSLYHLRKSTFIPQRQYLG